MLPSLVAAAITIMVLGAGAAMTSIGPWYRNLAKPSWNPPDWLFGPAWTLILGLAAWARCARVERGTRSRRRDPRRRAVRVNIAFHLAWSPLFFNFRRPDWALYEVPFLWLSIAAVMLGIAPLSLLASVCCCCPTSHGSRSRHFSI